MVVEQDIVDYFLQTSKGIKATAGYFGLSRSYVGALVSRGLKTKRIWWDWDFPFMSRHRLIFMFTRELTQC
jgi:hypothetical protein